MCWLSSMSGANDDGEPPTLAWRYAAIPIPVSFRHRTRAEVGGGIMARRGGTPPSFKSEGGREKYQGVKRSVHLLLLSTRSTAGISTSSNFLRSRHGLPHYRGRFRGVVPLFATLADPAADVADRELRNSNQPSELEYPSSPGSMVPLTTSPARMALRQTPYLSSARLSQVQRHFSTTSPVRKEIQDAYILSAARTPTGKVRRTS